MFRRHRDSRRATSIPPALAGGGAAQAVARPSQGAEKEGEAGESASFITGVEPRAASQVRDLSELDAYGAELLLVSSYSRAEADLAAWTEPETLDGETALDAKYRSLAWTALSALGATGVARSTDNPDAVGAATLSRDGILLVAPSVGVGPYEVALESYGVCYRFHWPYAGSFPKRMSLVARRATRRCRVSSRVRLTVGTDAHRDSCAELMVHDVSDGGVGVVDESDEPLFVAGQRLPRVKVAWKGGEELTSEAKVTHISRNPSHQGYRYGIELRLDAGARRRWGQFVDGLLAPRASLNSVHPNSLLEAYQSSGYMNLSGKRPEDFARLRQWFLSSSERLLAAGHVGATFAAGEVTRPEAFCHQAQVWPGSWLFYQLCRLPNGRTLATSDDQVLVDLYQRAFSFVQRQPEARWLVTYIQADAGYSRAVHCGCVERWPAINATDVRRVTVLAIDCQSDISGVASRESELVTSDEDVATVAALLRARLPHAYVEATGLGDPVLKINRLEKQWEAAGLERWRRVVVAKRQGSVVGAAVLEAASPGMHLFGLLDCVRIFTFTDDSPGVVRDLLLEAKRWYVTLGRSQFIYFKDRQFDAYTPDQGASLGDSDIVVQAVDRIPLLLEHVYQLAAPSMTRSSMPMVTWTED